MNKMSMVEAGKLGGKKTKDFWQNKYLENPKNCKCCGKQIPFEKKKNQFCDSSCASKINNLGVARNFKGGISGLHIKKDCIHCGNLTTNEKYCCKQCQKDYEWNQFCIVIENTGRLIPTNTMYGYTPKCAKRYLKEKRGNCCEICKNIEWCNQPIPLVLDHINGDPEDHRLENIRLVCGNCNMLLPTFAGKNKGKGRKNRK